MSARLCVRSTLSEALNSLERVCAQIALAETRIRTGVFLGRIDVDRAAPVLRRLARFERAVLPLRVPVLALQFLDGAVEVLDLDGAVVLVVGDHLEERAAGFAIPVADIRLRNVHGTFLLQCPGGSRACTLSRTHGAASRITWSTVMLDCTRARRDFMLRLAFGAFKRLFCRAEHHDRAAGQILRRVLVRG